MKKIISLALSLIFVLSIGAVSVSAQTMTNNQIMLSLLPTDIKASEPADGSVCQQNEETGIKTNHQMRILHESDTTNEKYVELKNFTENLVKDCTTDLEKVYTISNWVNNNYKYAFGALAGNTIETVYQSFFEDIPNGMGGNCERFTRLTNYMLYLVDVPTAIITSDKDGHEWGCALVNGEWIIVDSTNNYIGNDYLERFTIEQIFFATPDGACYVIDEDFKKVTLSVCDGFQGWGAEVDVVTVPSFVTGFEEDTFKYFDNGCMLDNDELVIKGEKGSYAETYVLKNYACVNYSKNNTFTAYKKHNYKETILKNATCKKDGLKKCVCTICGEKTKRVIKAHHNFKRVSKKSTVFNSGFKNYKICKDCGYEKPFEGKYLSRLSLKNTSFKIIAEKEKIKITYKKISGANGFIVRYKKVGDNKYTYKKFKTTKSAKKYIKNLKKNKKYYISFQVYKNENNKKVLSQWSKTRKITVK